MAEIAVTLLLPKLTRIIENEMVFHRGQDVLIMKSELERMGAYLRLADEENDDDLKIWERQIRDLVQEAEDVIDEQIILMEYDNGNGFFRPIALFRFFSQSIARHFAAVKLRSILKRTRNLSNEFMRLRQTFSPSFDGGDALLLDEGDLVGIQQHKEKILGWLIEGDVRRVVVTLIGMAGSGKSTLAKQAYDHDGVKKHFAVHAWITVSPRCMKEEQSCKELLKGIVRQISSAEDVPVPSAVDSMNSNELKIKIKDLLNNKRYLVVLDNVSDAQAWEYINRTLPNNHNGSRVMLTTQKNDLLSSDCLKEVHPMDPLSSEDSLTLLRNRTFKDKACPVHLKDICNSILSRCEGLPLAIVAISGVLARRDKKRLDEWEMIQKSLGTEIESNRGLHILKKVLSLSFNDLPYYLKPCFLYTSMFPEDYPISRIRLIRLWIAERLVDPKAGKEPEELADEYFNQLVSRSLLQVTKTSRDGRIKSCRLHDLVRVTAINKSREQNFAFIAKGDYEPWPEKIRRLSVISKLPKEAQSRSCSQLRSLLTFGDEIESRESFLSCEFKLLNVIDLEDLAIEKFPRQILNLVSLRYLSMKRTKIDSVPAGIGALQNLETLNLKHTRVTELPVDILRLKKLRHLLAYRYEIETLAHFNSKYGFKGLKGLQNLKNLQKLSFVETNGNGEIFDEISQLTHLRRLGIMKLREKDGDSLCMCLENLQNLRALSLLSEEEDGILDLHNLDSAPHLLQRLYLVGRLERLPQWIQSLGSLVRLHLKWSRLREDPLELLQVLPNLVHLELLQAYEGERLICRARGFMKLKHLSIDKFDVLTSIAVEEGAMPRLEKLHILRCKKLTAVPLGIHHLKKLKVLQLVDMNQDLVNSLRDDEGGDYCQVEHIAEVYIVHLEDGECIISHLHGRQTKGKFERCWK